MSTVAARSYDYGDSFRVVMAADKRMSWHATSVTKMWQMGEASPFIMVGGAGNYPSVLQSIRWLEEGADPDAKPTLDASDFHLLCVDWEGNIWVAADSLEFMALETTMHAIGSGGDYALGAMHAGATPERSIQAASTYDPNTGNGIDTLAYDFSKETP